MQRIRIGEILVQQGVLSERQVKHVLEVQRKVGRPFGDLVERLYGIDPQVVAGAWVEQYAKMAGTLDVSETDPDKDLLRLVSRRQAWQFHLVPLKRDDANLCLATTAENLVRAVNFATRRFSEPVYLAIAEPKQLHALLMKHYPVPNFIAEFAETF
jgi:MSHA biogenesis protein MshE